MVGNRAARGASKGRGDSREREAESSSWTIHVIEMKESLAGVKKDTEHASEELRRHDEKLTRISDTVSSMQSSMQSVWTAATVVKWALGVFLTICGIALGALGLFLRYLPDIIGAFRGD